MADSESREVEERAAEAIGIVKRGPAHVTKYGANERDRQLARAALRASGLIQEVAALRKASTPEGDELNEKALKAAGDLLHRSIEPPGHECSPGCKISADALAVIVIDAYLEAAAPTPEEEGG